ncbi:MAG TPA: hypothetical protein VEL10_01085 [Gaiellaceae bacterium]|nr:hypothetical protein [Gaiellaceae bacterium]
MANGEAAGILVDTDLTTEDGHEDRPYQDSQVHPERPARGVHSVEPDFLRKHALDVVADTILRIENFALTSERKLRETRDSGLDLADLSVRPLLKLDEVRIFRTRSDQTHLPAQHIPELRHLIELVLRKHPAEPSEAIVVRGRQGGACDADTHLSELQHSEFAPVASDAAEADEDRTRTLDPDRDCQDDDQRHERNKQERSAEPV